MEVACMPPMCLGMFIISLVDQCTFQGFNIALSTLDNTSPHCHSSDERMLHDITPPRNI